MLYIYGIITGLLIFTTLNLILSRVKRQSRIDALPSLNPDENLIEQIAIESQVAADRLGAVVEEVNGSINSLTSITDESTRQEQHLRDHSRITKERIESAFTAMQEVAASAEQIRDSSTHMADESQRTQNLVLDVCRSLTAADQLIGDLQRQHVRMERQIVELQGQTNNIENINTFISGVVSQTSLLALNASIEAAHAGENGRGFSIVAQEIKKLAEQSQVAVKNSSEMLGRIEKGVQDVVAAVNTEKQAVQDTVAEMVKIKGWVDLIFERTMAVNHLVGASAAMGVDQSETTNQTIGMLKQVVDTVDLTMASIDHTLAQMQAQRRQINGLQKVSLNLEKVSGDLVTAVSSLGRANRGQADDQILSEARKMIIELSSMKDLRSLNPETHESILSSILNRTSEIEAIWSNHSDGAFIYSLPAAGLLNAKGREWWKKAMDGQLFVSDVYISSITKKPCITLSTAICDDNGANIGVIGIDIRIAS